MAMAITLKNIIETKRVEVAQAKKDIPLSVLQSEIETLPRCRNFYRTLTEPVARGIHVIAEIKKASPSAGLIREDFDPVAIAGIYEATGANAISVLTDESYFQGRLDFLGMVKKTVQLPILRKDFIIDPYQVYQSRVAGADAILLIAEALKPAEVMDLMILANSLGLTVLLEVHEMESLLQMRSVIGFPQENYSLLGINNRNLKSMEVDLGHSLRMMGMLDSTRGVISESGIKSRDDVQQLKGAGFDGVLVGETLMRQDNIAEAFKAIFD